MSTAEGDQKRVCVVVLGDFGRSPRMQYHALSLAKNRFFVDVICSGGTVPHEDVISNPNIKQRILMEPPKFAKYISFVRIGCTTKVKWIIDWHNYGYTILALTAGYKSILVNLYRWCEQYFGRKAAYNFCVTEAMKEDLLEKWNIKAVVLYDQPPKIFHPSTIEDKHNLFMKLQDQYEELKPREQSAGDFVETKFTTISDGIVVAKKDRPVLLVSSTSWTEDEDFNILLDALCEYENEVAEKNLPDIICLVTGKGPLQSEFLKLISGKQFNHVGIVTPWLSAEDYPKLLGSADLGICLHTSSSGLDLPMKVVDMFGCELPVCAVKYKCLGELVNHGENGLLFTDSKELSQKLQDLLQNFPEENTQLQTFRQNLKCYQDKRWDQMWEKVALPFFSC